MEAVTAGNLVFIAATRDGYSIKEKQLVVIAAVGHGKFLTRMGDYVAYSLKKIINVSQEHLLWLQGQEVC